MIIRKVPCLGILHHLCILPWLESPGASILPSGCTTQQDSCGSQLRGPPSNMQELPSCSCLIALPLRSLRPCIMWRTRNGGFFWSCFLLDRVLFSFLGSQTPCCSVRQGNSWVEELRNSIPVMSRPKVLSKLEGGCTSSESTSWYPTAGLFVGIESGSKEINVLGKFNR